MLNFVIINRFIVVQTTYESMQRIVIVVIDRDPYRGVPKGVIKIARYSIQVGIVR